MNDKPTPCSSCKATIIFVKTPACKIMPLDYEPVPAGTPGAFTVIDGLAYSAKAAPGESVYRMPHWATCPNADRHRSRR
jgi:hypothetical protein